MEPRIPRILFVIATAFVAVAVLLGVIYALGAGPTLPDDSLSSRLGWLIPLLSGALIGGVAWILLSHNTGDDPVTTPRSVPCGVCGKPVLEDWRLCPHCGARLDRILVGHESRQAEEAVATGHE